jgi:hypothetical protein
MARQEETCWHCGAAWDTPAAPPSDGLGSLAARTDRVLEMRAGRRADSARRDRRPSRAVLQRVGS